MDKKSNSSSADLEQKFGVKFEDGSKNSNDYPFERIFKNYHLDLNFHQLRIIQLSLVYFDSLNRGNMCRNYYDDLYYTLRQIDRLISEDVI